MAAWWRRLEEGAPVLVDTTCPGPGGGAVPCGPVTFRTDDWVLLHPLDGGPGVQVNSGVCPSCGTLLTFCGAVPPGRVRPAEPISKREYDDEPDVPE